MRRSPYRIIAGTTALLAMLPTAGAPQVATPTGGSAASPDDGSLTYTFGFDTELRASDNRQLASESPGNSYYSETTLSFGIESETRGQTLSFLIENRFRLGTGKGAPDNQLLLPRLELAYARESSNALMTANATVLTRDLSIDDLPLDITDPSELLTDDGFEVRETLDLGLELGRNAPLGTEFGFFVDNLHYIDATDPDLYNRTTYGGSAALVFRPDTATAVRLGYSISDYDADDFTETRRVTQSVDLGAERRINPLTTISGQFGYKTVDETLRAFGIDGNDNDGFIAGVGFARELPTGFIEADLSHDVTGAGGRSDFSLTRGFELPTGDLELTLGVTEPEGVGLQPTGGVYYSHERTRQRFVVDASTRIIVADDDTVQRASRIRLSYDLLVNDFDSIGLSFDYARTDDAGGAGNVNFAERTTATAQYTHALTDDWDLTGGYTHRFRDQENSGSGTAHEIFVSLGRDISWRP
ncbi:MAG: hypothetical protein CML68_02540 [Rhodobacteraceae bacterium]|nr:hypothetical protein [Paracoccaceae bacterium]